MSAALTNAAAAAFAQCLRIAGVPISTANGVTAKCIAAPIDRSKKLRNEGYWLDLTTTAEIFISDALRLKIADRSQVILNGTKMEVMVIESHPIAPTYKLHLKPEH